jgi:hypothetical protein
MASRKNGTRSTTLELRRGLVEERLFGAFGNKRGPEHVKNLKSIARNLRYSEAPPPFLVCEVCDGVIYRQHVRLLKSADPSKARQNFVSRVSDTIEQTRSNRTSQSLEHARARR